MHGRADFMAHGGQKVRFRSRGVLGEARGFGQFGGPARHMMFELGFIPPKPRRSPAIDADDSQYDEADGQRSKPPGLIVPRQNDNLDRGSALIPNSIIV